MNRRRVRIQRTLISSIGGILIPLALFALIDPLAGYLYPFEIEWPTEFLVILLAWPLFIWHRVFPPPPTCPSCGTNTALAASVITIFIFWFVITYLSQILIGRLWAKRARTLVPRNA